MHRDRSELLPYVPDLRKNKYHLWLSKWHWIPSVIVAVIFYAIGGLPWLFWGVFLRTVISLHATLAGESATHVGFHGSRPKILPPTASGLYVLLSVKGGITTIIIRRTGVTIAVVRTGHELVRYLFVVAGSVWPGYQTHKTCRSRRRRFGRPYPTWVNLSLGEFKLSDNQKSPNMHVGSRCPFTIYPLCIAAFSAIDRSTTKRSGTL